MRTLLVAIVVLLGWSPVAVAQPGFATEPRITTAADVNVRTAPSTDARVDTVLKLGTTVIVVHDDQPRDTAWTRIRLMNSGREGYVGSVLLRRVPAKGAFPVFERIVEERWARKNDPFQWRVQIFDMLTAHREGPETPELAGRAMLLWMRAFRTLLAEIPPGKHDQPPYRDWFVRVANDGFIAYGEGEGNWWVETSALMALHDQHRGTKSADDIAWTIRDIGLGRSCRTSAACELAAVDTLDGGYLRQYPRGRHVSQALARIRGTSVRIAPGAVKATAAMRLEECESLSGSVAALRGAVTATTAAERASTLRALDGVAARCPSAQH